MSELRGRAARSTPNTPTVPGARPATPTRSSTRSRGRQSRATFFVQGRWAEALPGDRAPDRRSEGHLVGHHSHYHARMPLLLRRRLATTICATAHAAIADGHRRRPPPVVPLPVRRGRGRPTGARRARRASATATSDGTSSSRTGSRGAPARRSRRDAIDGVRAHGDGAVVLLHTWPGGTAEAHRLRSIDGLRELGATFVTIDDAGGAAVRRAGAPRGRRRRLEDRRRTPAPRRHGPGRRSRRRRDRRSNVGDVGPSSRMPSWCASTPRSTRPPSARGSIPARRPRRRPRRLLPAPARTSRPTTAGSSRWLRTNGWIDRADVCATTRSRCCARGPTGRGGSASSAASARTAPASRRTAASRGSPRSGRSPATGAAASELGGLAPGTRSAPRTAADAKTAFERVVPAHFGLRRPRQLMEAHLLRTARGASARRARARPVPARPSAATPSRATSSTARPTRSSRWRAPRSAGCG